MRAVPVRVVFHHDAGPGLGAGLAALADDGIEVAVCAPTDDARFRELMASADVLWHVLRSIGAAEIEQAPCLRLIQKIGVGVNTIDVPAAVGRGIAVCNLPGTNSRAVAEHALALMLAALRRIPLHDRVTRAGQGWSLGVEEQDRVGELAGRTVGLVGYGAVPQILAPILVAIGARVLYTARAPRPGVPAEWRTLAELLAESDVVSLHVPLTPETERMIDASALARMRPGAVLVNTARGAIVDERALVEALRAGHLRAAALDVFEDEPIGADNLLLAIDEVVLTPHVAWLTPETFGRSIDIAAENVRRLRAGAPLLHRVA